MDFVEFLFLGDWKDMLTWQLSFLHLEHLLRAVYTWCGLGLVRRRSTYLEQEHQVLLSNLHMQGVRLKTSLRRHYTKYSITLNNLTEGEKSNYDCWWGVESVGWVGQFSITYWWPKRPGMLQRLVSSPSESLLPCSNDLLPKECDD